MITSAALPLAAITRISPLNMHHGIDVGDVTSLAASIAAEGLLQPITVKHFGYANSRFGEPDYELYEVLAGRRRWQAIRELVDNGRMSPEELISVNVFDGDEADASLLSAVENLERINLHPVDQYEAFTRLIEQGSSEEKICKTFGISVRELQQRLALGQLSPRVRNAWRNGELKTEAAKLYTLGSIEEQDELLSQYHHIRSEPAAIRRHFRKSDIPGTDPRAQFIGENAYVDARGILDKTIFETFFCDEKLLDSLVVKKLEKIGEDLAREEGWGIVAVKSRDVDFWNYEDAGDEDELTPDEVVRIEEIEQRLIEIGSDNDESDRPEFDRLEEEAAAIHETARIRSIPLAERNNLAVFVELDNDGQPKFTRGKIPPQPKAERSSAGAQSTTSKVPSSHDVDNGAEVASHAASAPQAEPEKPGKRMREVLNIVIFEALRDAVRTRPDLAVMLYVVKHTTYNFSALTLQSPSIEEPIAPLLRDINSADEDTTFAEDETALALCAAAEQSDVLVAFTELISNAFRPGAVAQLSDLDSLMRALVKRGASLRSCFLKAMDYEAYFESAAKPAILAALDDMKVVAIDRAGKKAVLADMAAREAKSRQWLPHQLEGWSEPLTPAEADPPKKKRKTKDKRSTAQAMADALEADELTAETAENTGSNYYDAFLDKCTIADPNGCVTIAGLHEVYLAECEPDQTKKTSVQAFVRGIMQTRPTLEFGKSGRHKTITGLSLVDAPAGEPA